MHLFHYIDLFCGAGGTTTGVEQSMFQEQKCAHVIACVNHDPHAIASHLANHPDCVHFTEDIRTLNVSPIVSLVGNIRKESPGDKILLWASYECTNYSKAKGGQPRDADSRTLPEHLFRYIEAINPDYIQLENVEEFMSWGDLDENGHPISKDRGQLYLRWVSKVCRYGYHYDYRILNAADFGAYTSRKRYFGIFAKHGLPIAFPEPTHSRNPEPGLFGEMKPWKAVKEVLNFEDEGQSIFDRKKPLVDATLRRIMAGLKKFVVKGEANFLIKYNSMSQQGKYIPPSIDEPCPTVCTQSRLGVVKVRFLMKNFSGDDRSKCISIEKPAGTITCKDHHSFVTIYNGKGNNVSIDEPAPTVTTKDRLGLVNIVNFLDQQYGRSLPSSVDNPAGTITTNPKLNLVSAHWVMNTNFSNVGFPVNAPCQTVTANRKMMYLMNAQYAFPMYTTDRPCPTIIARQDKRPMYAVFTKSGRNLLQDTLHDSEAMKELKQFCREYGIIDIKMRMLRIDELLLIMGFPKDYKLLGTKSENKKYIGNAVECGMARKLCETLYSRVYD